MFGVLYCGSNVAPFFLRHGYEKDLITIPFSAADIRSAVVHIHGAGVQRQNNSGKRQPKLAGVSTRMPTIHRADRQL